MPPKPSTSTAGAHWQGAKKSNKYIDYGCFPSEDSPDVYCFCNTEPRIKAIRRVTRKESSPNLGREFWACGNWVEGEQCKFWIWDDQIAAAGRRYRSPPPPISAASTSLAVPASAPPSPQKRTRPVTPPPSSSRAPSHVPNSSLRPVSSLTERFDDIDFDALAAAGLEDEIEDDDEEEPPTQYSTQGGSPSPSPSKKQKFTSFGGGVREPTTPTKPAGVSSSSSSTFAAIQNDPDSPFHRIQRNLFGGGTDAEGDGASSASTLQPGSTPAPPSSSPSKPLPSSSATAADPSSSDLFTTLSASLLSLPSLLAAAQADHARTARLLAASKKKDETQRRVVEKMKKENEGLRRENEGLKERVRGLEEERNELRTRGR